MRRKSERTANKKTKASPEKKEKVEKAKRTRTRRRKQSTSSSESEPAGDNVPKEPVVVSQTEANVPPKPTKEDSPEESQEQVWHVKTTETSGDVGEIQKLKICLARPPSTPERPDRSPRSKRKHSRATSSSDTQSVEGEEKKKSKHRSKRLTESKDVEDKNPDSQKEEEEAETQTQTPDNREPESTAANVSTEQSKSATDDTPMSTTNEETKSENEESTEDKDEEKKTQEESKNSESQDKPSDADTTVTSPQPSEDKDGGSKSPKSESPVRKRSLSEEKSEILEIHAEESRCESSEISLNESRETDAKANVDQDQDILTTNEVSINKSTTEISGTGESGNESIINSNKNDVVESTKSVESEQTTVVSKESLDEKSDNDSEKASKDQVTTDVSQSIDETTPMDVSTIKSTEEISKDKSEDNANEQNIQDAEKEESNENESTKENSKNDLNGKIASDVTNDPTTPLVFNRKRRWGSRQSKFTTQKSITISTDILKEIIPDVKPTEFEEVIEEKKHKRVDLAERIERPVLPKIVIDNTDNVDVHNERKSEDRDKENIKTRDSNLASMRKISIVKENDSIITRPPSPPRHKQSNILYITNLVRPFTLSQLKNLLQRTGRIAENGFWIDRIKSKCFVKYENEDQAVETRHALHGVTWPVSNPKMLQVDFSTEEDFDKAKANEDTDNAQTSTIPGTVEDWLREQDLKRERGVVEKPWERKTSTREWDVGKNEKDKEIGHPEKPIRDEKFLDKRRHRTPELSPEPARKFKKKEEEAPAKLLDDLFRKTKTTPCIYWLPLSAETIAVKEEQRRQHMAEHERRLQELQLQRNRPHRRH